MYLINVPWISGLLSVIWLCWLFLPTIEGFYSPFELMGNYNAYPTRNKIRPKMGLAGFLIILLCLMTSLALPAYFTVEAGAQVTLRMTSALLAFQVGLPLLVFFELQEVIIAIGFLGAATFLHAMIINADTSGDPTIAKVLVLVYLFIAAFFIGFHIFIGSTQERESRYTETSQRKSWLRYSMAVLGAILTIMEFFNILFSLVFPTGRH